MDKIIRGICIKNTRNAKNKPLVDAENKKEKN
jgi:hypothetical protein